MIHEAIDAADSVIRALAVWIVLAAAVLTAALYALLAAGWAAWRMLRGAWAATAPRTDSLAPLAAEQPTEDPEPPRAPERNTATPHRTAPTWARKDAA